MQAVQKSAFTTRIERIRAGTDHTCGTVYVGPENTNCAERSARSQPAPMDPSQKSSAPSRPSTAKAAMRTGFRSAVLQLSVLGAALALYVHYVGL